MDSLTDDALTEALQQRWDELVLCYRLHRKLVDEIASSDIPLNETVQDFFAAGRAALEMALFDGVVAWCQHAKLSRFHTTFHGLTIDQHSECRVGFDADIDHPFDQYAADYEVQQYLAVVQQTRNELQMTDDRTRRFFVVFERANDLCGAPFQATTTATLHFARQQLVIDETQADALRCYFSVFGEVVAYEEHGLDDIARQLGEALGMDLSEPDQGCP